MKEVNIYRPMLDYSANESYKSLRTNLLFCGEEKKVIAITSCTPNEGKSTVSLNLALSLADSGKKVLLIDADLRKSVLLGRTEVDQEIKGLSHLLSHQETIENVIYATNIPRFNIIYAGTVPPNPAELLGAEYFKRVLAAVKKVYDYIIIDTPPLGSVMRLLQMNVTVPSLLWNPEPSVIVLPRRLRSSWRNVTARSLV